MERFNDWKAPEIENGKLTRWNWMVQNKEGLVLGRNTDIGAFCYINSKYGVEIQDDVQIGGHTSIYSESTIDGKNGKVILQKNCKIGTHCTVMPGVTIGENSIVGAHSFVNKDIPANVIAVGVPAKIVKEIKSMQVQKEVPLSKPTIGEEEIKAVTEVLRSGRLSLGPKTEEFEKLFAQIIGTKYAVAVNSGTSGLHLAVRALGITEDDEVITTPFSFIASANCALFEKAIPVFVDVDEKTFNIDPARIEEKITPKTKAILIVHVFGQSCDMGKIMELGRKYNLPIIEDACESILATYQGKPVGGFGHVAVFAFYPNKQMTTGEGGMIVTNRLDIYEYCKSAANQGRGNTMQWLTHDKLGYNYRLDEMSAALGVEQLKKVSDFIQKRQANALYYMELLRNIPEVTLPYTGLHCNHTWFVFPIRVDEGIRDTVIAKLNEREIGSKAYFSPAIHLQQFYQETFGYNEGDFPITEKLSKTTLILPFFTHITEEEIAYVAESLKEILAEVKR
ncbi:MAG TPA: DegT/DnrJ/EryC1/StrS family aminotransferase [Candidatus Nanoarchaeia archaeon]|nr:DegT/DnrJ/EryC1/StrS family aminotransferase [Candidatus Nanoarchaeia archaeon]